MAVVSVLSVSIVKPKSPSPQPRVHRLSNLDFHISLENYTKQVYYFPAPPSSIPHDELASSLKSSLAKVLVPFYVLAGRVRYRADHGNKLEVNCNDLGIPFVEASANASFSDWSDMTSCSIEQELIPPETVITDPETAPILKVQLTRFKCGGIALGVASIEVILDGCSYFEFMRSWSETHRNLPLSRPPVFTSEFFKPRQPPAVILPVRDYVSSPNCRLPSLAKSDHEKDAGKRNVVKLFHMNPDQVQSLIRDIQDGPFGYKAPSSFEATSAMIWKAMTEARDLHDSAITTYTYAVSLKGKNRWNPPVPASYVGNSIHSPSLSARVGDIRSNHLASVARLFREDILSSTQEHMQSAIDWFELELNKGRKISLNNDFTSGTGVYGASLHTFPVYEFDLGWAQPLHYSLVMQPWYGNGVATVLPSPKGGRHRQLLISLPEAQMKRLSNSELFTKYTACT